MSKSKRRRNHTAPPAASRWRKRFVVALALVALAGGGAWWLWPAREASGGTPRLVVDRETVELGFLPFETPARVVFTLANAGDGVLRIAEVPRVKAVEGC